jgi:N-hydroxyarylamine O-acetyltransferase
MEVRVNSDAHRMIRDGHHWILQAQTGDKMTDAWVSTLEEDNMIDFEVGNHFTSTHQNSPFRSRIMMRALTDEGRITVMNRDVTIRHGAESRQMTLADRQALRELLVQCFGFDLPEAEHIRVPSIPEWS